MRIQHLSLYCEAPLSRPLYSASIPVFAPLPPISPFGALQSRPHLQLWIWTCSLMFHPSVCFCLFLCSNICLSVQCAPTQVHLCLEMLLGLLHLLLCLNLNRPRPPLVPTLICNSGNSERKRNWLNVPADACVFDYHLCCYLHPTHPWVNNPFHLWQITPSRFKRLAIRESCKSIKGNFASIFKNEKGLCKSAWHFLASDKQ